MLIMNAGCADFSYLKLIQYLDVMKPIFSAVVKNVLNYFTSKQHTWDLIQPVFREWLAQ